MHNQLPRVISQIGQHVLGKPDQVKLALSCLLSGGHLLIEDLPGMGKTTLSHALAHVLGLDFSRVQFTSDLLPADLLGVNIFDNQSQDFRFHPGPVFSQVLLADEINRASPKTQSALLEAMEEHQVSLDGVTHALPDPFFVIGTQNPLHQSGTYPLPESQLDRFMMRISLGFPDRLAEKQMLTQNGDTPSLEQVLDCQAFIQLQQQVNKIKSAPAIIDYILKLVTLSRESDQYPNPLSPRASKAILISSKSWAFIHGRDYVIPEDVQAIFCAVTEHRLRTGVADLQGQNSISQQLLRCIDPLEL